MASSSTLTESTSCFVSTQYGSVRGNSIRVLIKCRSDEEYSLPVHEFLGIPYAMQPTGTRRFKPLEPIEAWPGVLNATEFKSAPIQVKFFSSETAEIWLWWINLNWTLELFWKIELECSCFCCFFNPQDIFFLFSGVNTGMKHGFRGHKW